MDPICFFQVEEHVHEAYVSVVVRIGDRSGLDLKNLCHFLNHVLFGRPAAGFILGDADISRPLRETQSNTQILLSHTAQGTDTLDALPYVHDSTS